MRIVFPDNEQLVSAPGASRESLRGGARRARPVTDEIVTFLRDTGRPG